jgi:hypothetical protein
MKLLVSSTFQTKTITNITRIPLLLLQSFSNFPFFPNNQTANHRKFAQQLTKTQEINPSRKAPTHKPQPNHLLTVQSHQLSFKPQPNLKEEKPQTNLTQKREEDHLLNN